MKDHPHVQEFVKTVEERVKPEKHGPVVVAGVTLRQWLRERRMWIVAAALAGCIGAIISGEGQGLHHAEATLMVTLPVELDRTVSQPEWTASDLELQTARLITSSVVVDRLLARFYPSAPTGVMKEMTMTELHDRLVSRIHASPMEPGVVKVSVSDEDGARALELTTGLIEEVGRMRGELSRSRMEVQAQLIDKVAERAALTYDEHAVQGLAALKEMLRLSSTHRSSAAKGPDDVMEDLRSQVGSSLTAMGATEQMLVLKLKDQGMVAEMLSSGMAEEIIVLNRPELTGAPSILSDYVVPILLSAVGAGFAALLLLVAWFQYGPELTAALDAERPVH